MIFKFIFLFLTFSFKKSLSLSLGSQNPNPNSRNFSASLKFDQAVAEDKIKNLPPAVTPIRCGLECIFKYHIAGKDHIDYGCVCTFAYIIVWYPMMVMMLPKQ